MRLLLLLTTFAVLNATNASSIAEEIVKNRDLDSAMKYIGNSEAADVLVNHLCNEFPELRPANEQELYKLKSQTASVLMDIDHYREYSAKELEEEFSEHFKLFSYVAAGIKQLRKLGKRAFAKLSEDEKKEYKNEDGFLLHHLEEPVRQLIEDKIISYKERRLNQYQIYEEIEKKDWEYALLWDPEDPYVQEVEAEKREEADHAIDIDRKLEATLLLMSYSSVHEVIEYVVNHLVSKYPELHPGSDDKLLLLKRELTYFWALPYEERLEMLATAQQSSVPNPDYPVLSVALKKLMKIGKSLKPLNHDEEEFKAEEGEDTYAAYKMVFAPALRHLDEKKAFYKKSGMGEQLIQKHVGSTMLKFINEWHKGDPNEELIEASRERVKESFGLHDEL